MKKHRYNNRKKDINKKRHLKVFDLVVSENQFNALEKATTRCEKSFYLEPSLDNFKKVFHNDGYDKILCAGMFDDEKYLSIDEVLKDPFSYPVVKNFGFVRFINALNGKAIIFRMFQVLLANDSESDFFSDNLKIEINFLIQEYRLYHVKQNKIERVRRQSDLEDHELTHIFQN